MARCLLIVYDNGSHIPVFPQGVAYLAAALREKGHHVDIWQQDIHHFIDNDYVFYSARPEDGVALRDGLTGAIDSNRPDVVGLGFVAGYYQYRKAKEIAEAVNRAKTRSKFKFVLGGHGPAGAPEYFLNLLDADAVFVGEADNTLPAYIEWLGKVSTSGNIIDANMWPAVDPDATPWPAYDMFPMEVYRLVRFPTSTPQDFCMPILSGRGCPYKCTFCYRMQEGHFKPRAPEAVIEEMVFLYDSFGINHFQFSDELFMSSRARVVEFCEAMLSRDIAKQVPGFKWDCNGRLNHATPDILHLMQRAGCEYVNYGVESLSYDVLKGLRKGLTVKMIHKGVQSTLEAGLTPGLNLMWGAPGDDLETLEEAKRFLLRYDTCRELRTIRPATPYPGSQMFTDAVNDGLIEDAADFYENLHVNSDLMTVNFTNVPDLRFYRALCTANRELIRNYYDKNCWRVEQGAEDLYSQQDKDFRGFRAI